MTWRLGLVLSLLVVAISGCGDSAGAEESVVVRTAREDYVEIRSLLTGGDAQSWWADLRGSRMSMGLWVVAEDTDGEPPVLLLGPERDGPAEVTLRLDEAFDWEGAVGDEVVVSGVARTLRLNPFHLVMDEGIAQPTKRSSKAREPAPTVALSIEPDTVAAGEAVTLRWESRNARGAKLNHGIGRVETTGSRVVRLNQTKTYTATVRGSGGVASASAIVTVR